MLIIGYRELAATAATAATAAATASAATAPTAACTVSTSNIKEEILFYTFLTIVVASHFYNLFLLLLTLKMIVRICDLSNV